MFFLNIPSKFSSLIRLYSVNVAPKLAAASQKAVSSTRLVRLYTALLLFDECLFYIEPAF